MKIKEVIVVEGKNDTSTLKKYFDCETIETGGSSCSDEVIERIRIAQQKCGVIIFTDPDAPGNQIRQKINDAVDGCKNAFIQKAVARTDKKVGIEHAKKEDLQKCLEHCITYRHDIETCSRSAWNRLGLSGRPDSQAKRDILSTTFYLGKANSKTLWKRCNMLGLTEEEIEKVLHEQTNRNQNQS